MILWVSMTEFIKFLFWNDCSFVSSRKYEYVIQVINYYDINYNAIYC